jgi:hypothetical protein
MKGMFHVKRPLPGIVRSMCDPIGKMLLKVDAFSNETDVSRETFSACDC